jgi:AcrR family transcriptional regulator
VPERPVPGRPGTGQPVPGRPVGDQHGRGPDQPGGPACGEPGARRPRGRPRSETARQAILAAAGDLMLSGGLAAATMDAIAARAHVSKATVYKWWPSRGAVALDGFLDRVAGTLVIPPGLTAPDALAWQIGALVQIFRDTTAGPLMRALVAEAQSDPDIARALSERWLAPRRAVSLDILRAGEQRGEIRPGLDHEAIMDQLFAPVYHRLFFGHAPLADDLAPVLVSLLVTGIGPPA